MKTLNKIFISVGILACIASCKKGTVAAGPAAASFNFVNANVNAAPLAVQFNHKSFIFSENTGNEIGFGISQLYTPAAGNNTVTLIQSADTTTHLYQNTYNLVKNGIYTFFLTGTVTAPDEVFIKEDLPVYSKTDSVTGVRFINLSPGSNPVSVDIQGEANGSEVQSLNYKTYTSFKQYTANSTISSYTFEFRDQATGTLLTTYTLSGVNNGITPNSPPNTVIFLNQTLALIGQPAGGQSVMLVPQY